MGYAGGKKLNPTYRSLGDHTEAVQIDYDPEQITYEDLLKIFLNSHNPSMQTRSRQYMYAVFYHDEHQKKLAGSSMKEYTAKTGRAYKTAIAPLVKFYRAEDYHQKFRLTRHAPLRKE